MVVPRIVVRVRSAIWWALPGLGAGILALPAAASTGGAAVPAPRTRAPTGPPAVTAGALTIWLVTIRWRDGGKLRLQRPRARESRQFPRSH